jgi:hypothetical protein
VRQVLNTLVKLCYNAFRAGWTWKHPDLLDFMNMLENIRTNPAVEELPSVSALVRYVIVSFSPHRSSVDYVLPPQPWHPTEEECRDMESAVLDMTPESFQNLDIVPPDLDLAREYISGLLRPNPVSEEEALSKLLGYAFHPPTPGRPDLWEAQARVRLVHLQRAEDILGHRVWDMQRKCEEMGIFHSELSVDRFFELVDADENRDKELEEAKRKIELRMRHFVTMVEENEGIFSSVERARAEEMRQKLREGVKWQMGEKEE